MHLTESRLVDSHKTDTEEFKATADHFKVQTMSWLPKQYNNPFNIILFQSPVRKCTVIKISVLLSSALTIIKKLI